MDKVNDEEIPFLVKNIEYTAKCHYNEEGTKELIIGRKARKQSMHQKLMRKTVHNLRKKVLRNDPKADKLKTLTQDNT